MRKLILSIIFFAISAYPVDIDVYQKMLHGLHDSILTSDTADADMIGAVNADSNAHWTFNESLFGTSAGIHVDTGRTYWVTVQNDATTRWSRLAVFAPDSNWLQVDTTVRAGEKKMVVILILQRVIK